MTCLISSLLMRFLRSPAAHGQPKRRFNSDTTIRAPWPRATTPIDRRHSPIRRRRAGETPRHARRSAQATNWPRNRRLLPPLVDRRAAVQWRCHARIPATTPRPPRGRGAVRWFGRLQLLRLLGKSERTMAWRVADPASGQELMLVLPRRAAGGRRGAGALAAGGASRVAAEPPAARRRWSRVGVQDGWPFVAYDARDSATLAERLPAKGLPGLEAAALADAGAAGPGLRPRSRRGPPAICSPTCVLVGDSGQVRLAGLAVATTRRRSAAARAPPAVGAATPATLRAAARCRRTRRARQRRAAAPVARRPAALDEPDIGRVIARLPPAGPRDRAAAVDDRAPDRRAAARHRQPRDRPPGAPALPQRAHAAARAAKAGCRPSRRRRRAAGAAGRPAAHASACCRRRRAPRRAPRGWR